MTFSIALGAFQAAGGRSSWAYLYSHTNLGAVGVFANLNHMGTLLLVSIPFATALLVSTKSDRGGSRQGRIAIGIAGLVLILTGIFLNGSLAVLALAPPVLLASAALVPAAARWRWIALPLSVLSLIGAVGLLAFSSPGSTLSSLSESTSVQSRHQLWTTTTEAIHASFPAGTGLGTFEQAYRQHEKPAEIVPRYVNNAHNDYLEFVLELGAPGLVLIVLFLAWWGVTALKVWTSQLSTPVGRSATIASVAILAHSIVDYPLRTSAIMAIFGAALAMMVQRQRSARPREERQMRSTRHVKLG
ncbi:MAG: O-antigen ligase family protein [Sphingomonas sp.]|nr:O-antigen ligase family protein [Sphingomonas sp.]